MDMYIQPHKSSKVKLCSVPIFTYQSFYATIQEREVSVFQEALLQVCICKNHLVQILLDQILPTQKQLKLLYLNNKNKYTHFTLYPTTSNNLFLFSCCLACHQAYVQIFLQVLHASHSLFQLDFHYYQLICNTEPYITEVNVFFSFQIITKYTYL